MVIKLSIASSEEAPKTIIHSYLRCVENITLSLSIAKDGDAYEYSSLDIINEGSRLSLTKLLKIVDSKGITLTAKELADISSSYGVTVRDELIVVLIRTKYTVDDELAVQRKAIQGNLTEFEEYSAFVQRFKNLATAAAALIPQEQEDEA